MSGAPVRERHQGTSKPVVRAGGGTKVPPLAGGDRSRTPGGHGPPTAHRRDHPTARPAMSDQYDPSSRRETRRVLGARTVPRRVRPRPPDAPRPAPRHRRLWPRLSPPASRGGGGAQRRGDRGAGLPALWARRSSARSRRARPWPGRPRLQRRDVLPNAPRDRGPHRVPRVGANRTQPTPQTTSEHLPMRRPVGPRIHHARPCRSS